MADEQDVGAAGEYGVGQSAAAAVAADKQQAPEKKEFTAPIKPEDRFPSLPHNELPKGKTDQGRYQIQQLNDAGFSPDDIANYKADLSQKLLKAGFAHNDIDTYFGDTPINDDKLKAYVQGNADALSADDKAKIAENPAEIFRAGLQHGATSLMSGRPELKAPPDMGLGSKFLYESGQMINELPEMVGGFALGSAVGTAVGGGTGTLVAGPPGTVVGGAVGGVLGGGAGANALPTAMREILTDYYAHEGANKPATWNDIWTRASAITVDTLKSGGVGAAAGGAGTVAGRAAGAVGGNVVARTGAEAIAMAGTATTVGAAIEGRVPTLNDFVTGAALAIGMSASGAAVGTVVGARQRFVPSKDTAEVAGNLKDIYVKTGINPKAAVELANGDPSLLGEILAPHTPDGKVVAPQLKQLAPPEPQPFKPEPQIAPPEPRRPTVAFGDSLAVGTIRHGGMQGTEAPFMLTDRNGRPILDQNGKQVSGENEPGFSRVGATPNEVLRRIKDAPDESVRGQDVLLSTGASNDRSQLNTIPEQIQALKDKGARSITIMGVGDKDTLHGVNQRLAIIADDAGGNVSFIGPLKHVAGDGIHSTNYRDEIRNVVGKPAPAAKPTEPTTPTTPITGNEETPKVPDSILSAFPDMSRTKEGAVTLNGFSTEERQALEKAGLVKDYKTEAGEAYRGVDYATLSDLRDTRRQELAKPKPTEQPPVNIIDKTQDTGFGERFGQLNDVKGIIVHHTAGRGDVNGVINTFQQRGYPAQFVIDREGNVYRTLPEGAQGRHIMSGWGEKGEGLSNANTVGIEVIGNNDADILPAQKQAAGKLINSLAQQYHLDPKTQVLGHGEVNPGHKEATEGMGIVNGIRSGELTKGLPAVTAQATTEPKGSQPKPGLLIARTPEDVTDAHLTLFRTLEGNADGHADHAVSPSGAIGRNQIMPDTARQYKFDPDKLQDPDYNDKVAKAIVSDLSNKFEGNVADMLVAYNAGPARARMWIQGGRRIEDLPVETQKYLEHAERLGALNEGYNWKAGKRTLAKQGDDDSWVPQQGRPPTMEVIPPGEAPPGGGKGPPAIPGAEPPEEGGPPLLTGPKDAFEKTADTLRDEILDIVGDREERSIPNWLNPQQWIRSFQAQLAPARRLDDRMGIQPDEIGAEDMLRQTYGSAGRVEHFIRWGVLDPISFNQKSDASLMAAFHAVKNDKGNTQDFWAYLLSQRALEKAEQGEKAELSQKAAAFAKEAEGLKGREPVLEEAVKTATTEAETAGKATQDAQDRLREANQAKPEQETQARRDAAGKIVEANAYVRTTTSNLNQAERAEVNAANRAVNATNVRERAEQAARDAQERLNNTTGPKARENAQARLDRLNAAVEDAKAAEKEAASNKAGATNEAARLYGSLRDAKEGVEKAQRDFQAAKDAEAKAHDTIGKHQDDMRVAYGAAKAAEDAARAKLDEATKGHAEAVNERQGREKLAADTAKLAEAAKGVNVGIDLDAARAYLDKRKTTDGGDRYARGAQIFRQVMDGVVDYARDSGMLSEAQAAAMKDLNQYYVTMRRIMDPEYSPPRPPGRNFGVRSIARKMLGSDRQIDDPLTAVIDNIHNMISMADRNRAVVSVINEANKKLPGEPALFTQVKVITPEARRPSNWDAKDANGKPLHTEWFDPQGNPLDVETTPAVSLLSTYRTNRPVAGKNEFVVFNNGRMEVWRTKDSDLADVMNMPWQGQDNPIKSVFVKVAGLQRAGITSQFSFPFRAVLHGQMASTVLAREGGTLPYHDIVRGFFDAWGELYRGEPGEAYKRWVANGGADAALQSIDAKYVQRDIDRVFTETGNLGSVWNFAQHPIEAFRAIGHTIDSAARIGNFIRQEEQGVEGFKAAMNSRMAYLDHAEPLASSWLQSFSRMVPFMSVAWKDMQQFTRAMKERPIGTTMKATMFLTAPTVLNYAANYAVDQFLDQKDRYTELAQWERDLYWVLPPINGIRMKIPRPYVVGTAFATMPEHFLDFMRGESHDQFMKMVEAINRQALPPVIPTLAYPIGEAAFNYNFFTNKPLIKQSLEKVSGPMKYEPNTTETAKALARVIGAGNTNIPGANPIVSDEFLKQWAGPAPYWALKYLEAPWKPDAKPWEAADLPFVGAFMARQPTTGAQSIADFYKAADAFETAHQDLSLAARRANPDEMARSVKIQAGVRLETMKNAMTGMNQTLNAINANPKMTTDEKRRASDQIAGGMIATAHAGLQLMDNIDKAGRAAQPVVTPPNY